MANRSYEWILFDWNGTLLDDVEYGITIVNKLCHKYSVPTMSPEFYLKHFGFPLLDFYKKIGFDLSPNSPYSFDQLAQTFMELYHADLDTVTLHSDVENVLGHLYDRYSLGIISAYKQDRLDIAVKEYGLSSFFKCIYGIADDRAASKSDSLKTMLLSHSIPPEKTLIVGDTLHDYEVAQENGIDCVLIEAGHQSKEQWDAVDSEFCIESLAQLPQWIAP